jgi:hypothetical protein
MTAGEPGFAMGFVTAWSLVLAFTCLLSGLVLESFKATVREHIDPATAAAVAAVASPDGGAPLSEATTATGNSSPLLTTSAAGAQGWTRSMTGAYAASYGLAYACTTLYSLFFLVLLCFQKAVARTALGPSAAERQREAMAVVAAGGGGGSAGGGLAGLYSAQASAI